MIDPKPFVDKAEAQSGQKVLAHGEARLRSDHQLGEEGLLCAVEDGLVFVEEDLLSPGEVTRIGAADVRVARLDQGFLDATLVVDTGEQIFHFEAMKEEPAAAILEQADLPQRLTDAGASAPGTAAAELVHEGEHELFEFGADPLALPDHPVATTSPAGKAPSRVPFTRGVESAGPPSGSATPAPRQGGSARFLVSLVVAMVVGVGFWFARQDAQEVDSDVAATVSPPPLVAPVAVAPSPSAGQPATLRLLTPQTDVHVFIDGVHKGKLPLVIPMLEPGTVELRFERGGSGPVLVKRVELLPGKAHTVNVELPDEVPADAGASAATAVPTEASPALLNCNSIPPSTVFVDGRQVGRTPLAGVAVQPGRHIVVFVHDTRGRKTRSVAAQAGQTVTVMARFAPPPASPPPATATGAPPGASADTDSDYP